MEQIRYAWGEARTISLAISDLARNLRPSTLSLGDSDRKALARTMIRNFSGKIQLESFTLEWTHDENVVSNSMGDLLYTISL